jgi:D-serine deaminase-like pyridoxal phosphate-dependent protein
MYVQPVGTPKQELDTPALILDLDVIEGNIRMMADFLRDKPAKIRPHMKTHKTPELAYKQLAAGAIGVTCAKLGEAEVMAQAGIRDILIANQIIGPVKIERLMSLARRTDIMVAVDDEENVRDLDAAAGRWGVQPRVLVEVDNGTHRCGVQRGEPTLRLASVVAESRNLRLAGVMGYEGFAVFIPDAEERAAAARGAMEILTGAADDCRASGLEIGIVSGGGTGTYATTGAYPGVTEIQSGSYITMDARYKGIGMPFECGLTVLATVISRPRPEVLITDLGMKQLSHEFGMPHVLGIEGAKLTKLSEEHGQIEVEDPSAAPHRIGDTVEILPTHGDTTINLHDYFFCVRNGTLEFVLPVGARGKSR